MTDYSTVLWPSTAFYDLLYPSISFYSLLLAYVPEHSTSFCNLPSCSIRFYHFPRCSVGFHGIPECSLIFHMLPSPSIRFPAFFSDFGLSLSYLILSYLILSHFSNLPLSARFWWLDIVAICTNIWEVILGCDNSDCSPKNPMHFRIYAIRYHAIRQFWL